MASPAERFATPRMAAGALFVDGGRILLVRKTYGNRWDIPGGYLDRGESPRAACRRELREELAIDCEPLRLLVHDWAPSDQEGDKVLYVFDCGDLGTDQQHIRVDGVELNGWEWVPVDLLDGYVIPRLARRLSHAYRARHTDVTLYLEHGVPVLG